jgi:meso-butanediol dehydrogenase/(S,S)-butanediol dehydrogenase/diacetyl reductase
MFRLDGRLAVVTGAGRGNGAAIAKGLAEAGARVVVTDVDGVAAQLVADTIRGAGGQAWAFALDVSDSVACEDVAATVRTDLGPASCVVNNAGILLRSRIAAASAGDVLDRTLAVNLHGPFNVTRAFLRDLRATSGCVVNVGSIQSFVAAAYSTAYAVFKGAVAQLTRTLADDGIRVNAIAPGLIETDMTLVSRSDEKRMASFRAHTPMQRMGVPRELVGPVVFLASDAAS